jgi:hypothetical protein
VARATLWAPFIAGLTAVGGVERPGGESARIRGGELIVESLGPQRDVAVDAVVNWCATLGLNQ